MKVKSITFNWFQSGNMQDGIGEDWSKYEVGKESAVNGKIVKVTEIIENVPHNGLEQWNFLVLKDDGSSERIFNINSVEYFRTTH